MPIDFAMFVVPFKLRLPYYGNFYGRPPLPQSWMTRLVESFQWFGQHYPYLAADYPKDLQGWLTMVALDTGWKGRVKTALKSCRQYRMRVAQGRKWTMSITGSLRTLGIGFHRAASSGFECLDLWPLREYICFQKSVGDACQQATWVQA